MSQTFSPKPPSRFCPRAVWWWLCWAEVTVWSGWFEYQRALTLHEQGAGILAWAGSFWNPETTLPFLVLLSLPLLCWLRPGPPAKLSAPAGSEPDSASGSTADPAARPAYLATRRQLVLSLLVLCCVSVLSSLAVGTRPVALSSGLSTEVVPFAELPPAYHDEYSYLLQARTYLAGRLSWPAAEIRPDLFHQFHVLNHDRTASRYFPLTGLWIAPFLAFGQPIWGHWLAGAGACGFLYLALVQLIRQRAALPAALLVAGSPGLAIFSNLLLAHHPVLLALSVFLWAFLRLWFSSRPRYAVIAGMALSLAMLGRPMTAAGFALPCGIVLALRLIGQLRSGSPGSARHVATVVAGISIPLLAGFAALSVVNHSITGAWLTTGYQQYTETFTPRHRYGFQNAAGLEGPDPVRDSAAAGRQRRPPAVAAYDRWATNLTPAAAIRNMGQRIQASVQWSWAIVPVALGMLMLPALIPFGKTVTTGLKKLSPVDRRSGLGLILASLVSLHIAHVPYWFDGIFHYHYIFESVPLLLLLTGTGLAAATQLLCHWVSPRLAAGWVLSLVVASGLPGWVSVSSLWGNSKVDLAVSELAYSRVRMEYFRRIVNDDDVQKPALILVDESGSDFQLSYIINPADLQGPVLTARMPATAPETAELQAAYPDRQVYVFDPQSFSLVPLSASN